jgi:flavin reductase (DIM6/NTAB) family NADH-FMN oxidoreductase RutF
MSIPHASPPDELKHQIGKPLGKIPSGVYILTARHDVGSAAMLASWVQQAAFSPPAVSVAVAKDRPIARVIKESGRFALSVISEHDKALMKRYARGIKEGEDPFAGMHTAQTPAGLTVLADALAWLEASVIHTCDFGADHELIIGQVTAAGMFHEGHAFTHQRGNGFHY